MEKCVEGFENVDDSSNINEKRDKNVDVEEPKLGMSFSSEEEVGAYYTRYAKQVGFGVTKRSSKTRDDGKVRYFTLACVRQGTSESTLSNILKPRPMEKKGCKVLGSEDEFCLSHVVLEHTHVLSPRKGRYIRCHKRLDPVSKKQLEYNDRAGIWLSKSYNYMVFEVGGYENLTFGERDNRNYIREARLLRLGMGGAEALQIYFIRMLEQNDGFYYVMDVDDEFRVRNVFGADARSWVAYKYFRDVTTFDTTYLTNAYKMPFAPFVRVNHHGQSILFGCGLISGEDTKTLIWLFESWFNCMNGRTPADYVNSEMTLKQFVYQYDNALRRKVENESAADFSSFHTQIPCISHYAIDRKFQEVYTNTKFQEVQDEFRGLPYCCQVLISCEGAIYTYQVTDKVKVIDELIKWLDFVVYFNDKEF